MTYLIPILLLIGSEIENIMQPCKKLYEVGNFLKICSKHQIESNLGFSFICSHQQVKTFLLHIFMTTVQQK